MAWELAGEKCRMGRDETGTEKRTSEAVLYRVFDWLTMPQAPCSSMRAGGRQTVLGGPAAEVARELRWAAWLGGWGERVGEVVRVGAVEASGRLGWGFGAAGGEAVGQSVS